MPLQYHNQGNIPLLLCVCNTIIREYSPSPVPLQYHNPLLLCLNCTTIIREYSLPVPLHYHHQGMFLYSGAFAIPSLGTVSPFPVPLQRLDRQKACMCRESRQALHTRLTRPTATQKESSNHSYSWLAFAEPISETRSIILPTRPAPQDISIGNTKLRAHRQH